jgi:uncharacterized protein with GYD domain
MRGHRRGHHHPPLMSAARPRRGVVHGSLFNALQLHAGNLGSYDRQTRRPPRSRTHRREAARKYIESVGGKLHGFWYAFGPYDGYNLWEAPDDVSMAAVAIAIGSGGALSKIETTPLLTVEETLNALGRARNVAYRPPGA